MAGATRKQIKRRKIFQAKRESKGVRSCNPTFALLVSGHVKTFEAGAGYTTQEEKSIRKNGARHHN